MYQSPRGVFVPTPLIFNPQLPNAALVSWIKLRSLARRGFATPAMSLPELAAQLGIHVTRLSKHLAQLQDLSVLAIREAGHEKIILTFPQETTSLQNPQTEPQDSSKIAQNSIQAREGVLQNSYFPKRILGYLSYDDEQDPFGIENDSDRTGSTVKEATGDYLKLIIRKPDAHALLTR
jgi:hypothetical protein